MTRRRLFLWGAVFFLGLSVILFGVVIAQVADDPRTRPPSEPGASFTARWPTSARLTSTSDMRFVDDALRDKIRRFDYSATQLDGNAWYRQPFMLFPNRPGEYFMESGSFRDSNPEESFNYHGPREGRWFRITAYYDPHEPGDLRTVGGIHVHARWKPAGVGWSAEVVYTTFCGVATSRIQNPREEFELRFQRYTPCGSVGPAARLALQRDGGMTYDAVLHAGSGTTRTEYHFVVRTDDPDARSAGPPDAGVLRILASPEALRDYGLKCLDYLAAQVENDFASGTALRNAILMERRISGPLADRPPSSRKLTDPEKQLALADARRVIRSQAAALMADYKQMYAAVLRAVPITDCLRSEAVR